MILQAGRDLDELLIAFRKILLQTGDRLRGTDTGNHVLALGIDQIFAVNALRAGGRISCKGDAGAGGIAHVSEYHGLYVDGGSPVAGDVIHPAVHDGALVVPGTEYGLDRFHELYPGILREVSSHPVLIDALKALNNLFQVVGSKVRVKTRSLCFLDLVKHSFKKRFGNFHYHIREHLDESAVGIIGKSGIPRLPGKALHGNIGKSQVQDRIHHSGHGRSRAGTDGNQKRILRVAEGLSLLPLQLGERGKDLSLNFFRNLFSIVVVVRTGFRRYGKALRNGKAKIGHLRQIGALSAQKSAHVGVALLE